MALAAADPFLSDFCAPRTTAGTSEWQITLPCLVRDLEHLLFDGMSLRGKRGRCLFQNLKKTFV